MGRQRGIRNADVCVWDAEPEKGRSPLCGVTDRVLSHLRMTKTDTFLPVDTTRDESVAALHA
jgi:hypothetical protein